MNHLLLLLLFFVEDPLSKLVYLLRKKFLEHFLDQVRLKAKLPKIKPRFVDYYGADIFESTPFIKK